MRKIVFLTFLCFLNIPSIFAQNQDPWVGDWTSETYTYIDENVIESEYRLIIRITKNGDSYSVRGKTIKVGDSEYIRYFPRLTVTRIESNTMWLQASESQRPFVSNGEIDTYSDVTWYYTLTLENGALHYVHYRTHSVRYDRYMRYKNEEEWDPSTWKDGHNLMLYNDNW